MHSDVSYLDSWVFVSKYQCDKVSRWSLIYRKYSNCRLSLPLTVLSYISVHVRLLEIPEVGRKFQQMTEL